MSTILCIDTASDTFALAVDRDGALDATAAEAGHDHSRLLLPAVRDLMKGERPDAIVVIIGPGAYAGVRVGIATAEGLAVALGCPLYGIGTLEAAACAYGPGEVSIIHPAGRGEFALQPFRNRQPAATPRVAKPSELAGLTLAGEGAGEFGGREIGPRERCEAALRDRAPKIRAGQLQSGAEAFYLREPNITLSRRAQAAS